MKNRIGSADQTRKIVRKPYLTGLPLDENTLKNALRFLGILIILIFVSFVACSSVSGSGSVIRMIFNPAVILIILLVLFNNGSNHGADAVAKGEILYQKESEGEAFTPGEKKVCFHPLKGYFTGVLGSLPFIVVSVVFALNATITRTGAGALPSWMQSYTRRSDIAAALVSYLQPEEMTVMDFLRVVVRICMIPFVNLVGAQNPHGMLLLEKLSPLIMLLPAASYGTGYLTGRSIRTKVHTMISENDRKRKKKEIRAQKKRAAGSETHSGPEQLN